MARIGRFKVARIVERIEHAENIDAVFAGEPDETFDHIVGIIPVSDQVLAAQQHLERRVFGLGLDLPQPFPRILTQEAQAHVERGAAPAFERIISDIIDDVDDAEHIVGPHARGPQRLVRVAQCRIGDAERYLMQLIFGSVFVRSSLKLLSLCYSMNVPIAENFANLRSRSLAADERRKFL